MWVCIVHLCMCLVCASVNVLQSICVYVCFCVFVCVCVCSCVCVCACISLSYLWKWSVCSAWLQEKLTKAERAPSICGCHIDLHSPDRGQISAPPLPVGALSRRVSSDTHTPTTAPHTHTHPHTHT